MPWRSPGSCSPGGRRRVPGRREAVDARRPDRRGRLETKLAALKTAGKLTITDDEISILQAVAEVESSGFTQCINTWDSDVVSFGFKQYTMAGKLQDLIKRVPTAFARYGIELSGRLKIKQGVTADGIKGVTAASELRGAYWATKFFQAGLDDEIIVAQAAKALEDLGAFETKTATQSATSAHMRTAKVRAILFELDNNRPAYVRPVVRRTLAQAAKQPDLTEAEFIEILGAEMEAEYVTYRSDHGNGATDEKARQKAKNIVAKTQRAFG